MAGISSKALGGMENRKKFVGQDFENDLGWDMYQFRYRTHDPQIGRFTQVDPLADKYVYNSTYAYAENKVINGIDLEGLEWWSPIIPVLSNSNTIVRGPVIETVVESAAEVGTKLVESGAKTNDHHLIPRGLKGDDVVKGAREGGFKIEGKENKIPLEPFKKSTGEGQHGNHPNYNTEVGRRLAEFKKDNPNASQAEETNFVRNLVKELKETINNNPGTKINDLFKGTNSLSPLAPKDNTGNNIILPAELLPPKPPPPPPPPARLPDGREVI